MRGIKVNEWMEKREELAVKAGTRLKEPREMKKGRK